MVFCLSFFPSWPHYFTSLTPKCANFYYFHFINSQTRPLQSGYFYFLLSISLILSFTAFNSSSRVSASSFNNSDSSFLVKNLLHPNPPLNPKPFLTQHGPIPLPVPAPIPTGPVLSKPGIYLLIYCFLYR